MTNSTERPDLRDSVMNAYDRWDVTVRRPARNRRIALTAMSFLAVSLGLGFFLLPKEPTENIARNEPTPNQPVVVPPVTPWKPLVQNPVEPVRPKPIPPEKSRTPVFRGAEPKGKIRLSPGVQFLQGDTMGDVTGVTAPMDVRSFQVSVAGEVWQVGLSGGVKLKVVSNGGGFVLPTESGPVTVLFSGRLVEKGDLFGVKIGNAPEGTPVISTPTPLPKKK
jgi:hypothetical protein